MKNTIALKNTNDFQHVLKKGKWVSGDFISFYFLPNFTDFNMLGIAVGKKFSKSSVKRNRAKRLIKEAYRLSECIVCKGYSIVIVLKNNTNFEDITYNVIYKDMIKCLKKADVLSKEEELNV